jgi:hypothetical protein
MSATSDLTTSPRSIRFSKNFSPAAPFFPKLGLVPKWVKFLVAILLLPICVGTTKALWLVFRHSGNAHEIWLPLLAGAACWVVVFVLLPKPMWVYVVGHELTHAVWTWCFGGKVKKFKAGSEGGHVIVTKNNFVIALAPYFFPLYAVLLVLIFLLGNFIWGWRTYITWFHLLLGAAYAFHVTLTWHTLQTKQSDITGQGYLFSGVVIFLGNAAVLLFGVPVVAHRDLFQALQWWLTCNHQVLHQVANLL